MTLCDADLSRMSEAELVALRVLLDRVISFAAAVEKAGVDSDITLTVERGHAAALITLSTEVHE